MTDQTPLEDKEFFYVTYAGHGVGGCIVIPQHKKEGYDVNPDGMNLAAASQFLFHMMGFPVIIQNWKSVTRKRSDEFEQFVNSVTGGVPDAKKRPTHLSLVKEEKPPENK